MHRASTDTSACRISHVPCIYFVAWPNHREISKWTCTRTSFNSPNNTILCCQVCACVRESAHASCLDTLLNVAFATVSVIVVSLLLIPRPGAALYVCATIASINVGIFGYMSLWGVRLDFVSMVTIVMSIGFSVDFSAHLAYHFAKQTNTDIADRWVCAPPPACIHAQTTRGRVRGRPANLAIGGEHNIGRELSVARRQLRVSIISQNGHTHRVAGHISRATRAARTIDIVHVRRACVGSRHDEQSIQ